MNYIIDIPEGRIVIERMEENHCDPFDFVFELSSIPQAIEKQLNKGIQAAKEEKFREAAKVSPDRLREAGYERAEQIPEHIVSTYLNLKFSDRGKGLEQSKISRFMVDHCIVDSLNSDDYIFEAETSLLIDLSGQMKDLKKLVLSCLEKIMFGTRAAEGEYNYIL